jgi:hypothetical protein
MPRYFTRGTLWVEDDICRPDPSSGPIPSVPEHLDRFTGLLDADGSEIWCHARPIGFGRDEEW